MFLEVPEVRLGLQLVLGHPQWVWKVHSRMVERGLLRGSFFFLFDYFVRVRWRGGGVEYDDPRLLARCSRVTRRSCSGGVIFLEHRLLLKYLNCHLLVRLAVVSILQPKRKKCGAVFWSSRTSGYIKL